MNQATKPKLPSNPYKRSPIKKLEDLAGRARERKTIRYYLNLAASGDSPHLALIGQRGVGKTSLLNGAESIARELKLLPVRLDMNELKAKSPGRFWHDLYQTLALSMVMVAAKKSLRNALRELREPGKSFDATASFVLVLEPEAKKVGSHGGLPIDAAILINLWRMSDLTLEELETELTKYYPENVQAWLMAFKVR